MGLLYPYRIASFELVPMESGKLAARVQLAHGPAIRIMERDA
jgi:hypothetical protein